METLLASLVAIVPGILLAIGCTSSRWANQHIAAMRRISTAGTIAAFLSAVLSAGLMIWCGSIDRTFVQLKTPLPIGIGVYYDSLAAVMLLLVSFIGAIVCKFSLRYLDGDANQGKFLKWICFTLGSVLMLIVSRDLAMFTGAWVLTSYGLHHLMTHFSTRPGAILAARKKFLISRIGDLLLIVAMVLTYNTFGTFEYTAIFEASSKLATGADSIPWTISLIGTLYVLGAITKSAQFPLHSWLPDTMETPTPVSALMHAGIINAGGFLIIRLSPLVSLSHTALDFLAIIGAITAFFGGVVMLTQTSIKRSLAYSTMAQMGFMMLQCGLGAFSAALLHIIAHSLYKAHAFLSSGSVIETAVRTKWDWSAKSSRQDFTVPVILASAMAAVAIVATAAWGFGVTASHKPGAWLLGLVLTIAVTQLLCKAWSYGKVQIALSGSLAAIAVSISYFAAYKVIDKILSVSVSNPTVYLSQIDIVVMSLVGVGFITVFLVQLGIGRWPQAAWMKALYVHATNGFYLDIAAQKLTIKIWRRVESMFGRTVEYR